jgi:transposase
VHVVLVPDEREETLIRALLAALEAFGGVPLVTVWDNPKTVVLTRKGELIVWNPVFGQVALDYRFAPELVLAPGGAAEEGHRESRGLGQRQLLQVPATCSPTLVHSG